MYDGRAPSVHGGTTLSSALLYGVASRLGVRVQEDSYFDIEIDGLRHDAIQAVNACIEEWQNFLRVHNLM